MPVAEFPPCPLVNFMVVGAQKCGTSALADYLAEHPEICMAWGKEVHLFDLLAPVEFQPERIDRFYRGYFEHYRGEPCVGEATPAYWYFPHAIAHLHRYNPNLKLIVLVRDPIERALSNYAMERNLGRETWPVDAALLLEPLRQLYRKLIPGEHSANRLFCSYVERSRYRHQMANLCRYFPANQVLLLHSALLAREPGLTLGKICSFLELDPPTTHPTARKVRETQQKYRPFPLTLACLRWLLRKEYRWLEERFPNVSG